jgi:hypothetical protein
MIGPHHTRADHADAERTFRLGLHAQPGLPETHLIDLDCLSVQESPSFS